MGKQLTRIGRNLYIQTAGKSRTWIYRYSLNGRTHDLGLGSLNRVTVAKAEALADELRDKIARGIDPKLERGERRIKTPTFREIAVEYLKRTLPGLKHPKSREQWGNSLAAYVYPHIGSTPVCHIRPSDVARCLTPIWISHRETSRKLRSRVQRIMDAAKAAGHFQGDNPATLAILQNLLPQRPRRVVEHHEAMPWQELPAFIAELSTNVNMSARALKWTILTAVRTNDTLGARWSEIDEKEALWTIPPERTKTGKPHRVPLAPVALDLLQGLPRDTEFLFPNKAGKPMSNMAMLKLLRGIRPGLTVHGFRSTARDWCAENGIELCGKVGDGSGKGRRRIRDGESRSRIH
jgi:integrase